MQSPAAYPQPQSTLASLAPAFLSRLFAPEPASRREGVQVFPTARAEQDVDLAERVRMTGEW